MNCPHEDDIEYGKHIELEDAKYQIHNILCSTCGMVGTQLEIQSEEDPESYSVVDEIWHTPSDYYNNDIAKSLTIKMQEIN